jgi:two-component system cell cycle response regulator DivK
MKKTILVVEDDDINKMLYIDVLVASGYIVKSAANGEEALKILESESVCLIISDFQMPIMDGLTFFNNILNDENLRTIPLIGISGGGNKLEEFKRRSCIFLEKPINISFFLKTVKEAL